ncbi:hypothetical protein [Streptomyces sp. NPDC059176]|uniref:hypothetical protein n=1 Tax=Streptomyces sp. NPDC059176 TaxID=3346758 RepID=UPI0036A9CC6A
MRRDRAPRRLAADGTRWLWSVGHAHPDCRELLTLRRAGARHSRLRLVFRHGPGRIVAGGTWPSGGLGDDRGNFLNVNEPGVVRRFLDEATARGMLPTAHGIEEADGWPLFDALVRHEQRSADSPDLPGAADRDDGPGPAAASAAPRGVGS